MSKFGFSIFRPNQPTYQHVSSTLLVELLMDLCFFRVVEAFKTCFGLIFTFEPSVDSLYLYLYLSIYIFTLYDDNPQLTPTTLGPFRGSKIQAPSVFFPLGGELPEFVPELRVAWMCEGVNNFPCYWCVYIYIYVYTCECVFYICDLYILCYICVFFCIIEYYIYMLYME